MSSKRCGRKRRCPAWVARLKDEALQELEAARQARRVAAWESKELTLSTNRRRDALVAEAEGRLAAMLSAAEQEIDQAVAEVLRGCQRVHKVQGRPLVLPVEPANDAAGPEPSEAGVDPPTEAGSAAGGEGAA